MIPKQAIEKAIDGDWRACDVAVDYHTDEADDWEKIALDPTFWQALGKAVKWREEDDDDEPKEWMEKAVQFYLVILTGGDTEKFWKELLG